MVFIIKMKQRKNKTIKQRKSDWIKGSIFQKISYLIIMFIALYRDWVITSLAFIFIIFLFYLEVKQDYKNLFKINRKIYIK